MKLRTLPPEEAFNFYTNSSYTGFTAYSLDDLCELLNYVPRDSVEHHLKNNDLCHWARDVLGDKELARAMAACSSRLELLDAAVKRREELWNHLK